MMITSSTRVCGSLAYPNRRTTAPIMHNAGFAELDIDYRYFAFAPTDIGEAMAAIRSLNFVGVSVSKPYKEQVIPHLDRLDSTAQSIGAVNIVHNTDGELVGYNSDWIGAVEALKEQTALQGRRVAVLGSGGAARAVVFGLVKEGCDTIVFSRSAEKGEALCNDMGASFGGGLDHVVESQPDILVNATSIGSGADDDVPVSDAVFETANTAMDIIVRADPSALLRRANAAGAETIGGVRMLVLQGAFTFELFTQQPAPVETMYRAVMDALAASAGH